MQWWGWVRETPLNRPADGREAEEWGDYVFLTDGRLAVTLELAFPFPTSITFPHCLHRVFRSLTCPASGYLIAIPDSIKASLGFLENRCKQRRKLQGYKIPKRTTYSTEKEIEWSVPEARGGRNELGRCLSGHINFQKMHKFWGSKYAMEIIVNNIELYT